MLKASVSGLDENGPHRFICLSDWSPVGGPAWEGSDVVLLEEICHWGEALRL